MDDGRIDLGGRGLYPNQGLGSALATFGDSSIATSPLSPELLKILACPVPDCHGRLELRGERLVCVRCGLRYRIEERWPVLIPDEAEPPQEP